MEPNVLESDFDQTAPCRAKSLANVPNVSLSLFRIMHQRAALSQDGGSYERGATAPEPSAAFAVISGRQLQNAVRMRGSVTLFVSCLAALALMPFVGASDAQDSAELRPPSAFAGMSDQQARSRALFTEAAKVIMNPRCMNCHPASDRPTQGNDMHAHLPQVTRGADDGGVPGNTCGACHMDRNVPIFAGQQTTFQSMPGHPRWGLAPIEMAWEGKSAGEICRQIKDPQRNGGRDLALLHEHLAHDDLVGWAWKPGPGRDPVPGTQERLGELVEAWIDSGAACP